MRFEYDPNLVEQATFLAARRDPERECELHALLDPLYKFSDAELRQRAFREAHGEAFRRFGLDQIVPAHVARFELTSTRLARCIIREAERTRAQSVDLYRENPRASGGVGEQVLILALCPESFLDEGRLGPWLLRQLQHVEDMLDDQFAYECELPTASVVQQSLIRDRYAVLWDIGVESRLLRSGMICGDELEGLAKSFTKAFTHAGRVPSRAAFEMLRNAERLTHQQLLACASNPELLFDEGEGEEDGLKVGERAFAGV